MKRKELLAKWKEKQFKNSGARFDADEGEWITINGTHVQMNEEREMTKGHASLKSALKDKGKAKAAVKKVKQNKEKASKKPTKVSAKVKSSSESESKKPKQYSNTYISDLGEKIEVLDREGDTVTALVDGKKKKLPIEYMMEHTRSHVMEETMANSKGSSGSNESKSNSTSSTKYSNVYISDVGEKIEVLDLEGDTVTALVNGKKKRLPIDYLMEHTTSKVQEETMLKEAGSKNSTYKPSLSSIGKLKQFGEGNGNIYIQGEKAAGNYRGTTIKKVRNKYYGPSGEELTEKQVLYLMDKHGARF